MKVNYYKFKRELVILSAFIFPLIVSAQVSETFESTGPHITYWYANGTPDELTTPVPNPSSSGINNSSKVGRYVRPAGTYVNFGGELNRNLDFFYKDTIHLMVYCSSATAIRMDIKTTADVTVTNGSLTVNYTTPNVWQDLVFIFNAVTATDARRIVLFVDPGVATAGKTIYIDNLRVFQPFNWNRVWSDEFNYNGLADAKYNWSYEVGYVRNNEVQYYTNARLENAIVKNGNLNIISRKESFGGMDYTSASLKTEGKHAWTYGKMEARIKNPRSQGYWSAFWLLGQNAPAVGWPDCGEIDVMEHVSKEDIAHGYMHWKNTAYTSYGNKTACDMTKYHIFSIEWDENQIKWFVDGTQYSQANIKNNINSTHEFHKPFFILLNLAIGGSWPGNPDATTKFPDTMFVDYVRVYQQQQLITNISSNLKSQTSILVYPNPVESILTVEINSLIENDILEILIYDILGKELKHFSTDKKELQIDLSGLPNGMYILKAGGKHGVIQTTKFIKSN